jgi:hypothetical protein
MYVWCFCTSTRTSAVGSVHDCMCTYTHYACIHTYTCKYTHGRDVAMTSNIDNSAEGSVQAQERDQEESAADGAGTSSDTTCVQIGTIMRQLCSNWYEHETTLFKLVCVCV